MLHDIMAPERALPWLALAFAAGYALGALPFGVLWARVFGLGDLRQTGSGNIGATNVLRTGNRVAALLTLIGDGGKGAVAVLLFLGWGDLAAQSAGLGAVIGHLFPIWLRFRGGKGVATFLGIALALHWPSGLAMLAVWLAAQRLTKVSALGALAAATSGPLIFWGFARLEAVLLMILLGAIMWLTHLSNIRRLLRGAENRF
ncbi:MAG: glycerol-3-phosphate 1-O-acyltransferase PlsY [Pseudomonadota bacterium]